MVTASNLIVQGGHRDKAGQVEVHEKETDAIYVQEGEDTFVTGGKMIGGKLTKARAVSGYGDSGRRIASSNEGRCHRRSGGHPSLVQGCTGKHSYFFVKVLK
jgi:hypothetical protein